MKKYTSVTVLFALVSLGFLLHYLFSFSGWEYRWWLADPLGDATEVSAPLRFRLLHNRSIGYPIYPDAIKTPGEVDRSLTKEYICAHPTAERRNVSDKTKCEVFKRYGLSCNQAKGEYEIDHFCPLGLGCTNSIENLWPQPRETYFQMDILVSEATSTVTLPSWSTELVKHRDVETNVYVYNSLDSEKLHYYVDVSDENVSVKLWTNGGTATASISVGYYDEPFGFKQKDVLEAYLHREVCANHIPLKTAQDEILGDWVKAYRDHVIGKLKSGAGIGGPDEEAESCPEGCP